MRTIKFRGKRRSDGSWVYGLPSYTSGESVGRITGFTESGDDSMGCYFDVEVVEESVGEFTGLFDRNGNEIFEGDIIQHTDADWKGIVKWDDSGKWILVYLITDRTVLLSDRTDYIQVIGNIYENIELL